MLLGGILYIIACDKVDYQWPSAESVYIGTVTDIPHRKGKTIQATVSVEHLKDTLSHEWKQVNREIMLYWMPDSVQSLKCGDRICFFSRIRKPASDVDFQVSIMDAIWKYRELVEQRLLMPDIGKNFHRQVIRHLLNVLYCFGNKWLLYIVPGD